MNSVDEQIYEKYLEKYRGKGKKDKQGRNNLVNHLYRWVFNDDEKSLLKEIDPQREVYNSRERSDTASNTRSNATKPVKIAELRALIKMISSYDSSKKLRPINTLKKFIDDSSQTEGLSVKDKLKKLNKFIESYTSNVSVLFTSYILFEDYSLWFDTSDLKNSQEFADFLELFVAYVKHLGKSSAEWSQINPNYEWVLASFGRKLHDFTLQNRIHEVMEIFELLAKGSDEYQQKIESLKGSENLDKLLLQAEEVTKLRNTFSDIAASRYSLGMQNYLLNRVFLHAMLVEPEETSPEFRELLNFIIDSYLQDSSDNPERQLSYIAYYPLKFLSYLSLKYSVDSVEQPESANVAANVAADVAADVAVDVDVDEIADVNSTPIKQESAKLAFNYGVDSRLMFKFLALAGSVSLLCGIIMLSIASGNVIAGAATLGVGVAALVTFGIHKYYDSVGDDNKSSAVVKQNFLS